MGLKHPEAPAATTISPVFTREGDSIPRHELPAGELAPDIAYQIIHDELMLDGNARLNLATFVSTWMEPQARQLMAECLDKNMIDKDEYPQTAELEMRCVNILSRLWHAPDAAEATGCSTTGSSEAAMLGGLALKRRWQKRQAAGKPADRPNLVMGINVQVCWEKFANYWDVEMRLVPMEGDRFHLGAEEAVKLCDENTIGVVAILGSTFDGSYEPVEEICDGARRAPGADRARRSGPRRRRLGRASSRRSSTPTSSGTSALPRVASINASGHKYGLVYPGVGWIVWRDADALPADLIFWVNYLGDNMPTFALNFSRPGAQVVAQYYNFLRLGFDGYAKVHGYAREVATRLSAQIAELGPFELITRGDELPVFAFKLQGRDRQLHRLRRLERAARARLAGAGLHLPGEPRGPRRAARRRPARASATTWPTCSSRDLKRQLPRLQAQPEPVHDASTAAAFHH